MTIVDEFYCGSVAGQDADACRAWLQAGRDHRWAPPAPPPGYDWGRLVPVAMAVVVVVTLLLAARALRATRKPAAVRPGVPRPVAVGYQQTVAGTTWHDHTVPARDARTEAHSATSPGW